MIGERFFNLLKKRGGLEQVRVRSQYGLVARSTFTAMATLLIELTGTRKIKKRKPEADGVADSSMIILLGNKKLSL